MQVIRWTPHAQKKIAAREVCAIEVERTVTHPDEIASGHAPRSIYMRRYFDEFLHVAMLLRVVVEETETELTIITAYKTSKFNKYLTEAHES